MDYSDETVDVEIPAKICVLGVVPGEFDGKVFEITVDERNGELRLNATAQELLQNALLPPLTDE